MLWAFCHGSLVLQETPAKLISIRIFELVNMTRKKQNDAVVTSGCYFMMG